MRDEEASKMHLSSFGLAIYCWTHGFPLREVSFLSGLSWRKLISHLQVAISWRLLLG